MPVRIAYFITPHGFGHATRAAAVMVALQEIDPTIQFDIFTQVPRRIFHDSLVQGFRYYHLCTDIGLVQTTSLHEDLAATVRRLDTFFPLDHALITTLAALLRSASCALVLCDIAPMGIVAAKAAGVPSVLIENFTWDWIYHGYMQEESGLARHIAYLRTIFATADYHIQTTPVCDPCSADLTSLPVSRKPQHSPQQTRAHLGIHMLAQAVLLTMGGVPEPYAFLSQLQHYRDIAFVVLGAGEGAPLNWRPSADAVAGNALERRDNVVLLPHRPAFYSPDLIYACDAVVSKIGYSTLAEVYHAGVPLGYIGRPQFRETAVLASYITANMSGRAITEAAFQSGAWLSCLPDLLRLPRQPQRESRGAEQIARFVYGLVRGEG